MGYNISIGEAKILYDSDEPFVSIEAEYTIDPDAPYFDDIVGMGNSRSPGYKTWSDFCKSANIYELFYGGGWNRDILCYDPPSDDFHRETPLLSQHPGAFAINQRDVDYLKNALSEYKKNHPDAVPGFWEDYKVDNGLDPVLARLEWLVFWFDWAVKNCERPIIENT